jgi:broad specificity phosphatase PhoE
LVADYRRTSAHESNKCTAPCASDTRSPPQDELWTPETRESDEALATRAGLFLRWLLDRPEQRIAVVTHSSWLSIMFKRFTSPDAPESVTRWFENAELRTMTLAGDAHRVTLTSEASAAAPDFIPSVTAGVPMHATISTRSMHEELEPMKQAAAPAGH